jgi:hypothetical protein
LGEEAIEQLLLRFHAQLDRVRWTGILRCQKMGSKTRVARGPFLTSSLAPRGEICPLGVKFTPLFTPRGEHSLLFRRIEGRTENFTPRGQLHP